MPSELPDRLLRRGWWLLVLGFLTSWIFGIGLLFIFAAFICAVIGLFRQRVGPSVLLLVVALVAGFIGAHLAALGGIYAYNRFLSDRHSDAAHVTSPPFARDK